MILESKLVQNSNLAFPFVKKDKFSQKDNLQIGRKYLQMM